MCAVTRKSLVLCVHACYLQEDHKRMPWSLQQLVPEVQVDLLWCQKPLHEVERSAITRISIIGLHLKVLCHQTHSLGSFAELS